MMRDGNSTTTLHNDSLADLHQMLMEYSVFVEMMGQSERAQRALTIRGTIEAQHADLR